MDPAVMIAALDAGLASAGEDAILRRVTGTPPATSNSDVSIRVRIDTLAERALAGSAPQQEIAVIMSPSEIVAAGWPGVAAPAGVSLPSLPQKNDVIKRVATGRDYVVDLVDPKFIDGTLVRINLRATR